jgi:rubrerythrin
LTSGLGPKYTRDQLLDVLRRHVHAYKDDELFAQRILDIAAFLVEYRAYKRRHFPENEADSDTGKHRLRYLKGTEQRDEALGKLLEGLDQKRPQECKLCGAPTNGRAMCPNCGNMAF